MSEYRIVEHPGIGFEPQMLCHAPLLGQDVWQPLNSQGYWVCPESYSLGDPSARMIFSKREDAERVLRRATAINEEHIREVP